MRKSIGYIIVFIGLFFSLFFIASRDPETYVTSSWKSSLYVDPAGYNVYLPATFQYNFIHNFPDKMDSVVGYGFMVNKEKKVITKFTYGVALMQSPFYILTLGVSKAFGIENTGYSYINQVLIDICGIFYACLGLFFLYFFLCNYFSKVISVLSVLLIFIGTNTLYYSTILPGMSHVYSFFLVNDSLFTFHEYLKTGRNKYFLITAFFYALLILIRPINILFGVILFFINIPNTNELKSRLRLLLLPRNIINLVAILFLVFLPQFIYWKFTYGNFIADSYPGEGFTNLFHPRIAAFLFAPHNGALLYCPLFLILFFCVLFLFRAYSITAWSYVIAIGLVIYLSASWYLYFFGCGFGARNLVDYTGALAFPLAWCISHKKRLMAVMSPIIICCVFLNLKLMSSWDLCFWGKTDWSWKEYKYLLKQPEKNLELGLDSLDPKKVVISENQAAYHITPEEEYAPGFNFHVQDLTSSYFKKANLEIDVMPLDSVAKTFLVCMAFDGDSATFYNSVEITGEKGEWKNVKWFSGIPVDEHKNYLIKMFLMNKDKHEFYFRNFKVKLE
jgi:hypothetical protein